VTEASQHLNLSLSHLFSGRGWLRDYSTYQPHNFGSAKISNFEFCTHSNYHPAPAKGLSTKFSTTKISHFSLCSDIDSIEVAAREQNKERPAEAIVTMADEPDIFVDVAAAEMVSLTEEQQSAIDPLKSGFNWYTPPMSKTKEFSTGGHEWMISGHDMQVLTSTLPPGEEFITETGSFMFGSSGLKTSVELTLCARGGFTEGCQRIFGGESCVKVLLRNEGSEEGFVGITPNFPAKIIPIKVSRNFVAVMGLWTGYSTFSLGLLIVPFLLIVWYPCGCERAFDCAVRFLHESSGRR
jgi:hypothetical protein